MSHHFSRYTFPFMSPPSPTDSSIVKLSTASRKLHTSHLPLIKEAEDLLSLPDKSGYAIYASTSEKEEFCRPKRQLNSKPFRALSSRISQYCTGSVEKIIDKRHRFEKPSDYITSSSINSQSVAERKLDLTDDDVKFLTSYNQLLRKGDTSMMISSVLFTDEDFIKAFYKWDVESIRTSIGKGVAGKAQRIDISQAFDCLKASGIKKDIPIELFKPLYDYYCRRWEAHENLPVCRCSWVIIQQLNDELRNFAPSAKLA